MIEGLSKQKLANANANENETMLEVDRKLPAQTKPEDQEGILIPEQALEEEKESAKTIIKLYAIQRKLGFPHGRDMDEILSGTVTTRDFEEGRITNADIKEAVDDINGAFMLFADKNKKFGNQDGKTSVEEFENMRQELAADRDNPGLNAFREMQREYFRPDNLRNTE